MFAFGKLAEHSSPNGFWDDVPRASRPRASHEGAPEAHRASDLLDPPNVLANPEVQTGAVAGAAEAAGLSRSAFASELANEVTCWASGESPDNSLKDDVATHPN